MFGIGMQEITVILLLLIVLAFAFVPLILRKYYPNKLWLGIILALFFGTGQFYLPGGLKYFLGLAFLYVILKTIMQDQAVAFFITDLLSAGVMYWRFLKIQAKPWEKPGEHKL
jgi:hypothetical protein